VSFTLLDYVLVPVALLFIWRKPGRHRRTAQHVIPRERRRVVKAHGRRKGDWVTASTTAGWMVPTLARLPEPEAVSA
jgi:hypothetical protein